MKKFRQSLRSLTLAAILSAPFAISQPVAAQTDAALNAALASSVRDDDRARDAERHPAQTLAFFDVKPTQTVIEHAPGGGWYTRILAPYLAEKARYIAVSSPPVDLVPERYRQALATWPQKFPAEAAAYSGVDADDIEAYSSNALPASLDGQVDRVLIVRMMHNLKRWGTLGEELSAYRRVLKDDGLIGIVQHMAPEGMDYAKSGGDKGYLTKSDVVAMMDIYGFELAGESFVNMNPNDNADHPEGVWTLPPTYRMGDTDRAKYEAIGESNRMTLLFRKAK